jgi:hypothetical protein
MALWLLLLPLQLIMAASGTRQFSIFLYQIYRVFGIIYRVFGIIGLVRARTRSRGPS